MTNITIRPYESVNHPYHCIVVEGTTSTPIGVFPIHIFLHRDAIGYRATKSQAYPPEVMRDLGFKECRDGLWLLPSRFLPEGLQ